MLNTNDFIFGMGSVGSRISKNNFSNLFKQSQKLNISQFDVSRLYGKGLAEKYLLDMIKKSNFSFF